MITSDAVGTAEASPCIVSDLNAISPAGGNGKKGGLRHQRSGEKRASARRASGHSRGRLANAGSHLTIALSLDTAPTARG